MDIGDLLWSISLYDFTSSMLFSQSNFFFRKYVQPETHLKLKKNLNDLLRRHREFRAVLTAADMSHVAIGDLSFVSAHNPNAPADCSGTQNWTFLETVSCFAY